MQWQGRRKSTNVEDRRGAGATGGVAGRRVAVGGGLGSIVLIVLYLIFGGDPSQITQGSQEPTTNTESGGELSASAQEMGDFVSVVLADIEDVWGARFKEMGGTYREPKLVLYSGGVESACGYAGSSVGPFYCPGDEKVYLDLDYFEDMQRELNFEGDFALAYVIAHEVGHHVQNQLGITEKMAAARQRLPEREYNALSVRLELQADCLAGVWASRSDQAKGWLDKTDVDEALRAAAAIGDDNIQRRTQGMVVPESFTHGTSEQRARWFKTGLQSGRIQSCDTFAARAP